MALDIRNWLCDICGMSKVNFGMIVDEVERLIFDGTYANGERLDEAQLAARFSVSRTPVREALQRLASSGLVEHIPRRGVFVRHPGPLELVEMFEVMAELEATCARLAARRIEEHTLDNLRAVNMRCKNAVKAGDRDCYYDENETFHYLIYRSAGNGFLDGECRRLHHRLKPFRRMQLRAPGRLGQSMAEHEAIVEHLAARDGLAAAAAMRNHVAVQGEKFHHLMSSLGTAAE